ncbi:MAG: LysR family transcriptional regulator [Akkermansiaceae bacterium]|jgi:DNA-binding transcriptional LysR family regulator|nr:LysR family transcriptional regulator [Akkermansiaceae bacterium]
MTDRLPDLRQIRSFVSVVDEGSFTLAAKKLFLTQSAISHSMRALEEQLGCVLLNRLGRKVVMTREGEIFLHRCRRVLGELEQAVRELDGLKRWGQARVRVGAPHSLCQFLLPTVVREFRDCFPRCEPQIEAGDTAALLGRLEERELDLVFGVRVKEGAELESCPLFHDSMLFVVPPQHPWAGREMISKAEIESAQFMIHARATETRRLVERYFAGLGIKLREPLLLGDMESIKEMSKVGLGVGLVARWSARKELEEGTLASVPLGPEPVRREWRTYWARGRKPSLIEETFAGIARIVVAAWDCGAEG